MVERPAPQTAPAPRNGIWISPAALRHLFNRMLGQLHHCLATGQTYHPAKAFPHATTTSAEPAAA